MGHPPRPNGSKTQDLPDLGFLKAKSVLVTGGTGSFGRRFIDTVLRRSKAERVIVLSRDEFKQTQMAADFRGHEDRLRFFIGDVRDADRLQRAFHGVDYVVHAAALKQVPVLEYNPFEAVLTNVVGAQNVINAAIDQSVQRAVFLSTDKAVNPINLYGATKLCAEKLFVSGNAYAAGRTRFSVVRYGNVVGSRGSVIPLFLEKRREGVLPITDERMTRFWITLEHGVGMVLTALARMQGGEIFVPKIPSMRIMDLAKAVAPGCRTRVTGIRPGEKLHEVLLTEDESPHAADLGHYFVIQRDPAGRKNGSFQAGRPLPAGFRYASDTNDKWVAPAELRAMAGVAGDGRPDPAAVGG